jgi:GxxExxY protein
LPRRHRGTENMQNPDMDHLNSITDKIIKCAIEVHKNLGPGLLESIYEKAICYELNLHGVKFACQLIISIIYKGVNLGEHRLDLLVEDEVIVELKAVDRVDAVFKAQVLSYLRVQGKNWGF